MTLDQIFWVIMIAIAIWSVVWGVNRASWTWQGPFGSALILFLLIGMLGWRTFGPAVK